MILRHALENARDDRRMSIGMVSLAQRDGIAQSRISDLKALSHCHSTDWLRGLHFWDCQTQLESFTATLRMLISVVAHRLGLSSLPSGDKCLSPPVWSVGILDIDPVIWVLENLTCSDLEDRVGWRLAWQLRHVVTVSYQRTNSNT